MKIGIVVDHPNRDLPAFCLLAHELIKVSKKNSVNLIPMYQLDWNIKYQSEEFDIIIFNFLRVNNLKTIKAAHKIGIKVIIYDQEGVGGKTGLDLIKMIKKNKKALPLVDMYNFWGEKQYKTLNKVIEKKFLPRKINLSGWLYSDYIYKYKKYKKIKKDLILINSNFPMCDPKFNSLEREIAQRLNTTNIPRKKVLNAVRYLKKRKINFIHAVKLILDYFPKEKFVLRPHPYENDKEYIKLSKEFSNCIVSNKENLNDMILQSKLFIHVDCSTSIKSTFLNVPALSMDWIIQNKKLEEYNSIASACSIKCDNIFKLKEKINLFLNRKKNISFKHKEVSSLYGKFDGKRCKELAIRINNQFKFKKIKKKKVNFGFKQNIKFFLFDLLGPKYYVKIRYILGSKIRFKYKKEKEFTIDDIKKYININYLKYNKLRFGCISIKRN